jgi:hypothetical protein
MRYPSSALRLVLGALLLLAGLGLWPGRAAAQAPADDEKTLKDARLDTSGPALLEFFRKRTASDGDLAKIRDLIRDLGDDSFQVREKASMQLLSYGRTAVPPLREALTKNPDVEVQRRAEDCLRRIEEREESPLATAAARLLAHRKQAGTVEVLLAYAPSNDDPRVADELCNTLAALARKDGKLDPALVNALADKAPVRRSTAAVAICRSGSTEHRAEVRKLLEDADANVRLRVAIALVHLKEKQAVPVLIELLPQAQLAQHWQAEDILYRLAGEHAPTVPPASDEAGRRKYHDAWLGWWKDHADKIDLGRLDRTDLLGYTMVVLLDKGKVMELGPNNQVRWEVSDLQFPLDVQYLPGDRILVAEGQGGRVTERNFKGEILWKYEIASPLMAQRLPNGNTFITAANQMVEVDPKGKQVFSHVRDNGSGFMRGKKLPNGDIACVLDEGRFVRMDAKGKELETFPIDIQTSGGRIEVLPNGRVLVPQFSTGKVVEVTPDGKVQWEVMAPFDKPIAALRLPNGNTLVTSMPHFRAVELDRDGKVVWEYKTDTRVTRAYRR